MVVVRFGHLEQEGVAGDPGAVDDDRGWFGVVDCLLESVNKVRTLLNMLS